ncbi:YhgE/Pip domain-containing protein [Bacillus sp. MRMR6]|uniref:YhgE/Pip domain-containing protein n=1 Tax=Bacillus sp. MRMR6 TaxID=1928617 RepID=UPI0034C62424
MRKKRFLFVLIAITLVLPSFLVNAEKNETKQQVPPSTEGEIASKDEVIYATLSSTGEQQEIYVVNVFDVVKAGTIVDYGAYSTLKNLSDLAEIQQQDTKLQFPAQKGKFYYQGNLKDAPLPWGIAVSYQLDGKDIKPADLAGKDGQVAITIRTTKNDGIDPVFFENYLLQISLTLDSRIYSNIEAPSGMLANVGKNKQVTFTAMPDQEGNFSLRAEATSFELQGIEMAAVPSSMSIDTPDIGEMTNEMGSLADAIKEINNGVAELRNGVSKLNDGVANLHKHSEQYQKGMSKLDQASSELVGASVSIDHALTSINEALNGSGTTKMDVSGLKDLPVGLSQMANGLNETAAGITTLRENYTVAYNTLDSAMKNIPDYQISKEEIQALYASGADSEVLDKLVETYSTAQIAKGTYSAVKEGFAAVDPTLNMLSESISQMSNTLTGISNGLSSSVSQLQAEMETLAIDYSQFHSGLVSYTKGVGELSASYKKLHSGMTELSGGTAKLEAGAGELHNGTDTLYNSTKNLPDQMQDEIDKMMGDYDKSDFKPVSFVSTDNEKINSVQFVIKTESIKIEEQEPKEKPVKETKSFWTRLLDLFF